MSIKDGVLLYMIGLFIVFFSIITRNNIATNIGLIIATIGILLVFLIIFVAIVNAYYSKIKLTIQENLEEEDVRNNK